MQLICDLNELPASARRGAVTIGNFDGVHRGHTRIVEQTVRRAGEFSGPAVVFTFEPHPVRLLRPDLAPTPLTTLERKAERLAELGAQLLVAYPTDHELLGLSPREFFDRIVRGALQCRAIVEGPNFRFGRDRTGDIALLRTFADDAGIQLDVVEPLQVRGEDVSSSRIRRLLVAGDVEEAASLLGAPYRLQGRVQAGAGRGAAIGFPTANLSEVRTLLPAEGVYAAVAEVVAGRFPAAVNIGPNPTFGEHGSKVEAHLMGFDGSLQGQSVAVDLLVRLRDVRPFDSVDALKAQLKRDVAKTASIAAKHAATPRPPADR